MGVAFYCGKKKPPVNEYLYDFVKEIKVLLEAGIAVANKTFRVNIFCFTCDTPTRAHFKCIVQHTVYFPCKRCRRKDFYVKGQIVFDCQEESITERNDLNFRQNSYSFPDQSSWCHQLADSPLATLAVNLIKDFSFDYIRLVCLKVVRRMLHYFK